MPVPPPPTATTTFSATTTSSRDRNKDETKEGTNIASQISPGTVVPAWADEGPAVTLRGRADAAVGKIKQTKYRRLNGGSTSGPPQPRRAPWVGGPMIAQAC